MISNQWKLVRRPTGLPDAADFSYENVELAPLGDSEVRVANEFLSVDPYMRGRMNDMPSYIPPFELGKTMLGGAVGTVVESNSPDFAVGDLVEHMYGWRDVAQGKAGGFTKRAPLDGLPSSVYLGALGVPALTAWIGLFVIAKMQEGESVFISGAAGAVGTAAGQLAKLHGASRVVGSAGSAEKIALITSKYGYDTAFNYKDGKISRQLAAAAPDGIDVYFDNVGGDHLEAAIFSMNRGGRAAICGSISSYNAESMPPGPRNLWMLTTKSLTLEGFTIPSLLRYTDQFAAEVAPLVASGDFVFEETVVDGIDNALEAFYGLMRGENTGKMLVKI
ncbi:MAG TPA: NADP-dependent oxidoreductase [Galbitalea sp.]|nr:NADP-dependent oxidoreductase [Galbitalea sp.]